MKCFYTLIVAVFITVCAKAQDSTDELLNSRIAKYYVHFVWNNKHLTYQIDHNDGLQMQKIVGPKLCVAVPKRYDQINLSFNFINPFKKKIILTETSETDGAYESLSKFYTAVVGMNDMLTKKTALETEKTTNTALALSKINQGTTVEKMAKQSVATLNSKLLTDWKFNFLSRKTCVKNSKFFELLKSADNEFYRKNSNPYTEQVGAIVKKLLAIDSVTGLKAYDGELNGEYDTTKIRTFNIARLEEENAKAKKLIEKLENYDLNNVFDVSTTECVQLREYTNDIIKNFLEEVTQLLAQREAVVTSLTETSKKIKEFLQECDEKNNTMIVGHTMIDIEKVKIQTIKLRDVQYTYQNNAIGIAENNDNDLEIGKLRVRNYHFLIPEFAVGAFYTSLTYPKYDVKTENGTSTVGEPTEDNYSIVATANLNLVINVNGLVNPMLQFGVGTAKETPSILAGGGIRLSKPNHLALTGGFLWTWRKELDKYKVGDAIKDKSTLDSDLKHKLLTKPAMYVGITYGF